MVRFFCGLAPRSDKSAEANSVAHGMKNYSALNADDNAVLCPYMGSPICSCCDIWSRRARQHTMRESAPLAVKRYGGCKARQKPGMAGTDAVGPATLGCLDMLTINRLNFSVGQ